MFSSSRGNTTVKNILDTKCFGVNLVNSSMAEKVFGCIKWYGLERIEKTGFTLSKAAKINAPLVDECRAHLECELIDTKELGSGFVIFGEIVAASIWDGIINADLEKRYDLLDQIVYLENNIFAAIKCPRNISGLSED
jgi:flavin reductase (DIM6/NTAB) family NADH-FMN oxidoreductase RutF